MLGKLKSMVNALSNRSENIHPVKGAMTLFEGAGAANPTVIHTYNCTVARQGVGVYRVTISSSQFFGVSVALRRCMTLNYTIAPTAATAFFHAEAAAFSATQFDISVYAVTQGAGTTLARAAYDIVAGDLIDFSLFVNAGTGLLPEG